MNRPSSLGLYLVAMEICCVQLCPTDARKPLFSLFKVTGVKVGEDQINQEEGVKIFSVTSRWQSHQPGFCGAGVDVNASVTT